MEQLRPVQMPCVQLLPRANSASHTAALSIATHTAQTTTTAAATTSS
jgi:hypothetical protein